jgi:hypothetical protein
MDKRIKGNCDTKTFVGERLLVVQPLELFLNWGGAAAFYPWEEVSLLK